MHPIIYDVAVSADGFISGRDGDISTFPPQGPIVDDYLKRLAGYRTVIMGRATYEFGYRFGLEPGENPYPHANVTVVSRSLVLGEDAKVSVQRHVNSSWIDALKRRADGPIYLCGGGVLAATVMARGALDLLRLKRAPILLGEGTPLFARLENPPKLALSAQTDYGDGYLFQEFQIQR